MKKAYFAGGCFWCIASALSHLSGVTKIIDGYAGGDKVDPTYKEVKSQSTNHRETICIVYDESIISYAELLDRFFENVDLFDAEGQFIDRGFSYTLALFYTDESERLQCEQKIAALEREAMKAVCADVLPYKNFYVAEDEHQDYAEKNKEAFAEEYEKSGRRAYFEGKRQM